MPDTPKHRTKTVTRHEWTIGDGKQEIDAKEFRYGVFIATKAMKDLGIDVEFDDAYKVRVGDGAEVVLFIDIEEDD